MTTSNNTTLSASPNHNLDSPPSRGQRAKNLVKSIRRKSSQLFKRHRHEDGSPSSHRRSSPAISALIADSTYSALAISASSSGSGYNGGKYGHSSLLSDEKTAGSSSDSMSLGEESKLSSSNEDERSICGDSELGVNPSFGERTSYASDISVSPCTPPSSPPPPPRMASELEERDPAAVSPPPDVIEPEVPDPFDHESIAEEDNSTDVHPSQTVQSPTAAEEIPLGQSPSESASTPPSSPSTVEPEHPLPPLPPPQDKPSADSDDSDEETLDLYIPALTNPTMFLPIPNVRLSLFNPLTWWLSKSLINYSCIIRQIR